MSWYTGSTITKYSPPVVPPPFGRITTGVGVGVLNPVLLAPNLTLDSDAAPKYKYMFDLYGCLTVKQIMKSTVVKKANSKTAIQNQSS